MSRGGGACPSPSELDAPRLGRRLERCRNDHLRPCAGRSVGVPFTELDAVHHLADWTPTERSEFVRQIAEVAAHDAWVVDGNYSIVVRDGPVCERADTVVWLDVSKSMALRQVTRRTLGRAFAGAELWNGNRERWADVVSRDPERSMVRWVLDDSQEVRERYERLCADPGLDHLRFVRLRNRREMQQFLDGV